MATSLEGASGEDVLSAPRWVIGGFGVVVLATLLEPSFVVAASVLAGMGYHLAIYRDVGSVEIYAGVGLLTGTLYLLPFLFREEYRVQDFLDGRRSPARVFMCWNYAFICLAAIGFLTKTTDIFSRGWLVLFYALGLVTVFAFEAIVCHALNRALRMGRLARRRVLLVGGADEVRRMSADIAERHTDVRVAAMAVLPDALRTDRLRDRGVDAAAANTQGLDAVLQRAVAEARALRVDDVIILTDWSRSELIGRIVDAFTALPLAVHLGAAPLIGRFSDARIARIGGASALSLTEPPLSPAQLALKRAFDIAVASLALVLLAPLFALIALLIKRDSAGPVFFLQRRRGYNLQEFRIWKFRTMTTLDDGETVVQARPGDARVTRVGRFLRRYNFDELPQLINVLVGEMSIVGPRPHAVAHDKLFEQRIAAYPRRLNVKPGITGWAQINGFRGLTDTDDAMQARVEHDLFYIDNWSIALDLYIMLMTVVSARAFRNAH